MRAPIANGGAAFAFTGYFWDNAPSNQDSNGSYWSFTRSDDTYMSNFYFFTSVVYLADSSYRYCGFSIRFIVEHNHIDYGILFCYYCFNA